jgi:hypothetical protein
MRKLHLVTGAALAVATSLAVLPAQASTLVDTGAPGSSPVGGLSLDSNDWVAGEVSITSATTLGSIQGYISGDTAGETFTVSLYGAGNGNVPGALLDSATATFNADGWNGLSQSGWKVGPGNYWVAFEVGQNDTLASNFELSTMNVGAPNPLAHTAYFDGSGYHAWSSSIGLQVSAVPEPASVWLLVAGLGLLSVSLRRRRG